MTTREPRNILAIDLLDYLLLLTRWKRFLFINSTIVVIIAVIVALLTPKEYTASLTLLPPENEPDQFSEILGSGLLSGGGLSMGKIGSSLLSKSTPLEDVFVAILGSRTLRMSLIDRFNIVHLYKFDKRKKYFIEDLLHALDKHLDVTVTDQGTMIIAVVDEDPKIAADMANFAAAKLDEIYRNIATESVRNKRIFLQERLQSIVHDLDSCEKEYTLFQKQNKMFDIDAQTKATIDAGAALEAQYMAEELQYEINKKVLLPSDPKMMEQESALVALRAQRNSLENSRVSDLMIPLKLAPDLALEFVKLKRDLKIQEVLHGLILQQFETAKIEEAKQTPRVQILDNAVPPQKRSKPKRSRMVLFALFFSIVEGIILVKILDSARNLAQSNSPVYQKCVLVLQNMRRL
jgi:uncharacterized protein involved in exopolysaccharide biosynthesis